MKTTLKTVLVAAALAVSGAAQAGETWSTPEIAHIDELDIPGALAFGMRGALGDTGVTVGLAAICATGGPRSVEATAFFGGFPHDRRPVQLAVRTAEGTVHRFGPVVSGGPASGIHSPPDNRSGGRGTPCRRRLPAGIAGLERLPFVPQPGRRSAQPRGAGRRSWLCIGRRP